MLCYVIFPNCNLDTDDYDVIDPKNSTKGIAPLKVMVIGPRTEWSSIRTVILTKLDEHGVQILFAFTSNDYRQNWTTYQKLLVL